VKLVLTGGAEVKKIPPPGMLEAMNKLILKCFWELLETMGLDPLNGYADIKYKIQEVKESG